MRKQEIVIVVTVRNSASQPNSKANLMDGAYRVKRIALR